MKRAHLLMLSFVLALFLGACGGSDGPAEKLNGSWALDIDATINGNASMKDSIPDGEAGTMARTLIEGMLGSMALTFDMKASTLSGSLMGETFENKKFEAGTAKGDDIELKIDGEATTFTVKGDEMHMKTSDNTMLVFKRKQ